MTRFHFHLVCAPRRLVDETGEDLADLAAAQSQALSYARDLAEAAMPVPLDWRDWSVVIADEFGKEVAVVPLPGPVGTAASSQE